MAEQAFEDPSQLFFSIFDVKQYNVITPLITRMKVDVPSADNGEDMDQVAEEESKGPGRPRGQDFSSFVNSSPNIQRHDTNGHNGGSIKEGKHGLPFVSQLVFSANFVHLACLISGSINRVVIYEVKSGKIKIVAAETFPMKLVQEE